jgi:hypothetical protein
LFNKCAVSWPNWSFVIVELPKAIIFPQKNSANDEYLTITASITTDANYGVFASM